MKRYIGLMLVILPCGLLAQEVFKAHLPSGWYPNKPDLLKAVMADLDQQALVWMVPSKISGEAVAAIVPHAGYRYSGSVAAAGYRRLHTKRAKRVIILAPAHSPGVHGIALPYFESYQTPLGTIAVDSNCIEKLKKHPLCTVQEAIWKKEHSLEVQIPFIQTYCNLDVRIVPLIVGPMVTSDLQSIAKALKTCVDKNTLVVVSSDFTHHGQRFNYVPFMHEDDVQAAIRALDMQVINAIIEKKMQDVAHILTQTKATVCGAMPILLFKALLATGVWPDVHSELVAYNTSHAITRDDPASSVSYAAIIFKKGEVHAKHHTKPVEKKRTTSGFGFSSADPWAALNAARIVEQKLLGDRAVTGRAAKNQGWHQVDDLRKMYGKKDAVAVKHYPFS